MEELEEMRAYDTLMRKEQILLCVHEWTDLAEGYGFAGERVGSYRCRHCNLIVIV